MSIEVRNQQRKFKIGQELIKDKSSAILSLCNLNDVDLSILIVNNHRIKALNKRYRGIHRPTDVLAFPMNENNPPTPPLIKGGKGEGGRQPGLLGDIVISMEKTHSQAREQGHSPEREFLILLIHGILHLIGYDHERSPLEAQRMKKKENFILSKI